MVGDQCLSMDQIRYRLQNGRVVKQLLNQIARRLLLQLLNQVWQITYGVYYKQSEIYRKISTEGKIPICEERA